MIDTKCITRKYIIKGVNVTIKPFYTLGSFGGYIAMAENIAYDFIDYYYPATKNNYLEV